MKIEDPALMFETWLELAAFQAIKLASKYVEQTLPYEFKFELHLNTSSHDDTFTKDGFELYPEDDGRRLLCDTVSSVTDKLVRNNRIPVWIDILVYKYSREYTLFELRCAGRFTDNTDKLYYYRKGTGCFAAMSYMHPPMIAEKV